jgi:2,3-bisphosphoglycerate-dependent phosphoglycerate mutase
MWIPVRRSWRLNERHYGALQGLDKEEAARQYGEEQVHTWRRSYDVRPPVLSPDDERYPRGDPRYAALGDFQIPKSESLKDLEGRFLPYWQIKITPNIQAGRRVLIVGHGNCLRALAKYLDQMTDEAIMDFEIPTGTPLVYELDVNLSPTRHYYVE